MSKRQQKRYVNFGSLLLHNLPPYLFHVQRSNFMFCINLYKFCFVMTNTYDLYSKFD